VIHLRTFRKLEGFLIVKAKDLLAKTKVSHQYAPANTDEQEYECGEISPITQLHFTQGPQSSMKAPLDGQHRDREQRALSSRAHPGEVRFASSPELLR
jgi:hypothetical protein